MLLLKDKRKTIKSFEFKKKINRNWAASKLSERKELQDAGVNKRLL